MQWHEERDRQESSAAAGRRWRRGGGRGWGEVKEEVETGGFFSVTVAQVLQDF